MKKAPSTWLVRVYSVLDCNRRLAANSPTEFVLAHQLDLSHFTQRLRSELLLGLYLLGLSQKILEASSCVFLSE